MKIQKIKAVPAVALCMLCMLFVQSGFAQQPGNITGATHVTWLTPDGYSNGTWTNRIGGTSSNGNFIKQETAPATATGYNYHPSVVFEKKDDPKAPNRLQAKNAVSIAALDNITSVFVLKRKTGSHSNHDFFAFRSGHSSNNGHLVWNSSTSGRMYLYWDGDNRLADDHSANEGIVTIDNANNINTTLGGINFYHNGVKKGITKSSGSSHAYSGEKWVLGAGWDNGYGYEGEVQEVIILKAGGSNSHLSEAELLRLHSYLAVKYGIALSTNYVNSNNQAVWDRAANSGYNNDIFGIARDDKYTLHQKQSTSVNNSVFTAFTGTELMPFNSQNPSLALVDGMYVMFGSNGVDFNSSVAINLTNPFVPSQPINYRKGTIYKVQLTGCQENAAYGNRQTIKIKLKQTAGRPLPEYVLISSSPDFAAATTQIIPWRGYTIEENLPDGYYIAFAGHQAISANIMPAGITSNKLKMWLDAGNESSIKSTNEDLGASVLGHDKAFAGYPGSYPSSAVVQPVNNRLNTVLEWRDPDPGRNVQYELYNNSDKQSSRRVPVYSATPLEMNYHPAVQFWGGVNFGAYLTNTSGVFANNAPANNEHTAIFVVNNYEPVEDDRSYYMAFGEPTPDTDPKGYRPTYGIMLPKKSCETYAVMNTSADGKTNSQPLAYTTGSTAIMAYRTNGTGTSSSNHKVTFGINGKSTGEMQVKDGFGTFGFNRPSTMGIGYSHHRQLNGLVAEAMIFEEKLSTDNLRLVEAYLAVKYGITLKESGSVNYDYKMTVPASALYPNGINTYWAGKSRAPYRQFHNNVAAIIRDDESNLYNRQSHSTEVGSMLHVGIGGVPEAVLDKNGTKSVLGSFDHNKEVVVWGHNGNNGESESSSAFYTIAAEECYTFESVFKRRWLLHKSTGNDHPMQLLIGLQDNRDNNLGATADNLTQLLYGMLHEGNELYMIVATSMDDIDALTATSPDATRLKAIVPMTYANKEFQCSYNFTDSIYYITFGVRKIIAACTGTREFAGKKTFNWTQYSCTSTSNPAIHTATGTDKDFYDVDFDLGNGITGKTHIKYEGGITVPKYYPSTLGAPGNGITVRRVRGNVNSKVTIEIEFEEGIVVKPEFRISGLDEVFGRYERVEVRGYCSTDPVAPKFRPVSSKPAYTLTPPWTVTSRSGIRGASNRDGAVDVSFPQGVRKIVIEYSIVGKTPDGIDRNIYISPISCTSANVPPPPPPVNEHGLAFTTEAESHEIVTCETMQYSFYITNSNYGHKLVNFSDVLPAGLKWKEATVAIDTLGFAADFPNFFDPSKLTTNNYGGKDTLKINNIFVPCNSTMKLTAVVEIDSQFADNSIWPALGHTYDFANHAEIDYEIEENFTHVRRFTKSVDRQTLDDETVFTAIYQSQQEAVQIETSVNPSQYLASRAVAVKLKLTNSNPEGIDGMFLNVHFGAGFKYVLGSYSSTPNIGIVYQEDPSNPSDVSLTVTGSSDGLLGFTLPAGETEFIFQLRAPDTVQPEYDIDGNEIEGSKATLDISYDFASNNKEACMRRVLNLSDVLHVPYRTTPTHVIINKDVH